MADALLDDVGLDDIFGPDFVTGGGHLDIELVLVLCQSVGVDGGLGHEAVGEGQAEDPCDEAGTAEQEEVPVEAGGFFEGEAAVLGGEGGEVVVVVEEKHHEAADGEGDEDPFHRQVPEVDQPAAVGGGVEGAGVGHAEEVDAVEVAGDVTEADPEDGCDRVGVVGQ